MLDDETRRKLREMKMGELVEGIDAQGTDPSWLSLPFDERLRAAVDYAYEEKRTQSVRRLTQRARLRFPDADINSFDWEHRDVDRALVRETATCQFARTATNVIVEGATGSGKTYLTCAIAKQACRLRMPTRYIRMPDLPTERDEAASVARSDVKMLRKYSRFEVLALDEFLTCDVGNVERQFLFELVERRYGSVSTILCSQYSVGDWHARLGGGVQADAILDRLVHGAIRIDLGDANMRKVLSK